MQNCGGNCINFSITKTVQPVAVGFNSLELEYKENRKENRISIAGGKQNTFYLHWA